MESEQTKRLAERVKHAPRKWYEQHELSRRLDILESRPTSDAAKREVLDRIESKVDSLMTMFTDACKAEDEIRERSARVFESSGHPWAGVAAAAVRGAPAPPPAAEQVSTPPHIEQIAYKSPEEIMNAYPHLAASSQASDDLVRRGDVVAACARWMDEVRNNPLCPTLSSRIASIPRAAAPTFADGVAAAAKLAESDPYFQHQIATAIRTIKEPTT